MTLVSASQVSRLFQGRSLDNKLQELGEKTDWSFYTLSQTDANKYILEISKQKKTSENEIAKAFWHFLTLHEQYLLPTHTNFLLGIHSQLMHFKKTDHTALSIQKVEELAATLLLKPQPVSSIEKAREFANVIELYIRQERFGLVGTIFSKLLHSQPTYKNSFTVISHLMCCDSRKKLDKVFEGRVIDSFGCITYSQHCNSLETTLNALCTSLKKLHIGWGNSIEQLIEYKIIPCIAKQSQLEELALGTPSKDCNARKIDLSAIGNMTSLKCLKLYNICAQGFSGREILQNTALDELTIADNYEAPLTGAVLSGKKPERLRSLHIEGNSQYSINHISLFTKLESLIVIPQVSPKLPPGQITLPDLHTLTRLKTLTLYGEGFDSTMIAQIARSMNALETLEIKVQNLMKNAFFELFSHKSIKRLRITAETIEVPTSEADCCIEKLFFHLNNLRDPIDEFAKYICTISSIKQLTIAANTCSSKTHEILTSKKPPFEKLSFLLSAKQSFTSSSDYVEVISLSDKDNTTYRNLMVSWHELFPLRL